MVWSNVILKLINYSHNIILKYEKRPVCETEFQFRKIIEDNCIKLMRIKLFQHWKVVCFTRKGLGGLHCGL